MSEARKLTITPIQAVANVFDYHGRTYAWSIGEVWVGEVLDGAFSMSDIVSRHNPLWQKLADSYMALKAEAEDANK